MNTLAQHLCFQLGLGRVAPEIFKFIRIILQIVKLPLIRAVVNNHLAGVRPQHGAIAVFMAPRIIVFAEDVITVSC